MSGSRWSIRGRGKMRKDGGPVRSMSQPNDLDEVGKRNKKSKGILYYFQPWKWKKKQVLTPVVHQDDTNIKARRNSGKSLT